MISTSCVFRYDSVHTYFNLDRCMRNLRVSNRYDASKGDFQGLLKGAPPKSTKDETLKLQKSDDAKQGTSDFGRSSANAVDSTITLSAVCSVVASLVTNAKNANIDASTKTRLYAIPREMDQLQRGTLEIGKLSKIFVTLFRFGAMYTRTF